MIRAISESLHRSGILYFARLLPKQYFLVINFHRVSDAPTDFHDSLIEVKPSAFRQHIEWLSRRAEFISEAQIASVKRGGKQKILLTFDDGYRDSYEVIAPILESMGIPAIFFVTPNALDRRLLGPWDRIAYLVKKTSQQRFSFRGSEFSLENGPKPVYQWLGYMNQSQIPDQSEEFVAELAEVLKVEQASCDRMSKALVTWEQVRDLSKRGFAVGGHGFSHKIISSLTLEEQEEEMRLAKARLSAEKIPSRSFAFPFGTPDTFSWESREAVLAAGFEYLFSFYDRAQCIRRMDTTLIHRVAYKSTVAKYNMLLSAPGLYNLLQASRERSQT